jgi:hypothetical protein
MRTLRCLPVLLVVALSASVQPASAALPASGLTVESFAEPSVFSATHNAQCLETVKVGPVCDSYTVFVANAGAKASDGAPVTISDELPSGLTVQRIGLFWEGPGAQAAARELGIPTSADLVPFFKSAGIELCSMVTVSCSFPTASLPLPFAPDDQLEMVVYVTATNAAERALQNKVSASGGDAASVSNAASNEMGSTPAGFGVSSFAFSSVGADGLPDRQAADHPYELRVTIGLNNRQRQLPDSPRSGFTSSQDVKDVVVDLPLGFVGSTLAAPQCTLAQLSSEQECPPETIVGHLVTLPGSGESVDSPIWNLVPERGAPAEFGFRDVLGSSHVLYTHVVPSPAGYVLQTTSPDVPQVTLAHIVATFFGDPAERDGTGGAHVPFFTNPAICSAASTTATVHIDSWASPGRFNEDGTADLRDPAWVSKTSVAPPPAGCNLLQFSPELVAQPTTNVADTPSGLDLELRLAQNEQAGTHATPPLRDASVTFPEGFVLDPSAGDGLQACSEAQIGWEEGAVGPEKFNSAAPQCPEASKVGVLELETPLIRGVLTGNMYLAAQNDNPLHSVIGLYVVVQDPVTGVLIKIAGRALANPSTGQITGIFEENPQLPFSDLKLHFFGGPRAEFATPENCGIFTTTADLAPWSAPDSGPDSRPFDSFQIAAGCANGFAPAFTGGSTNLQAGAFAPFVASFSRADSDQELAGLSVTLPPGLLAKITGVPLCPDAQAAAGTCPEASRVGTVTAAAGPGPNPLFVSGSAYLTGPYNGGPYGLSVVVPAIAGPFNFGSVVVRQSLRIDPDTAKVTDVSDPFPTILTPEGADRQKVGIPIRLRRVDVSIDRPSFTFNPTSCNKMQVGGSISSVQGASSALAAPFQVTNCAALKFTPRISVTTAGATSRANGSSLSFKISYPSGSMGSQAWFDEAKFDIPRQLPARLTTIQQACLADVFDTNPSACPAHSLIGHAVVHTPVLPDPLSGPVYFVSHGGAKFPDAVIVLQGDGVHVDLRGETFIDGKTGITSATFRNTPDTPFESIEVTLPPGRFSEFGANLPASAHGSFCGQKLIMPTFFKAQNGLQIKQNTRVGVSGCSTKAKVLAHKVNGAKVTLTVYAPGAGRLTVTGKGLSTASRTTQGIEDVTLTVRVKHPGHARRRLHVAFTPARGRKQRLAITLRA